MPIEATTNVNKDYIGRLTLVITKSNYDKRNNLSQSYWPALLVNTPKSIAGVNSKDAYYIDQKIDTGAPYVGMMISGSSFTESKINVDARYNLNSTLSKCIMAFILPKFN